MENRERMQFSESDENLYEDVPDFLLFEKVLPFFLLHNFLVQVAIIRKLHNDAANNSTLTIDFFLPEKPPYNQ